LKAFGSSSTLGSIFTLVALARAWMTASSVSFSKFAAPFTVFTKFGIRSMRRWYWFCTSAQAAFTASSDDWIVL